MGIYEKPSANSVLSDKILKVPPKLDKKDRDAHSNYFYSTLSYDPYQCSKARKRNKWHKDQIKLSVVTDYMIIYIENS